MRTMTRNQLARLIKDGRIEITSTITRLGYADIRWTNGKRETIQISE